MVKLKMILCDSSFSLKNSDSSAIKIHCSKLIITWYQLQLSPFITLKLFGANRNGPCYK